MQPSFYTLRAVERRFPRTFETEGKANCGLPIRPWRDYRVESTKSTLAAPLGLTVTDFSQVLASVKTGRSTLCSVSTSKACSLPANPSLHARRRSDTFRGAHW